MKALEKTIQYLTYIFLFLLPWQTMLMFEERFVNGAKWEYGTIGMYGTEMLGWIVVLLCMLWYILRFRMSGFRAKDFRWSRDRLFLLSILLFVGYVLLGTLFAGEYMLASQHANRMFLGVLLFLLFYIGPIHPRLAMWAFVLGSIPVSILGIWQFLVQSTFASTILGVSMHVIHEPGTSIIASDTIGRWLRAYGSFSHPNICGGYLTFTLFSTLLLYSSSKRWGKVLLHAMIVLQSAALFFTFSRSAWMSVVIVLLFYCATAAHDRTKGILGKIRPIISIATIICILSAMYLPLVHTRFTGASVQEIASITERAGGYEQAMNVYMQHPMFGVVVGNYTYALMQEFPDMPGWWYQPVHVVPVLILTEVGLIGIILLLFVLIRFMNLQQASFVQYLVYGVWIIPLLLLDHYLWSSYVGYILVCVYSSLYFREIKKEAYTAS